MIQWRKIGGGAFKTVLPGMIICVRCAYFRYNCSKRWGWILHYTDDDGQPGGPYTKSAITRYISVAHAMAGAERHVREVHPLLWKEIMNGETSDNQSH